MMRKIIYLSFTLFIGVCLNAQNFTGSAHYTFNLDLPDILNFDGEELSEAVKNEISMNDTFTFHFDKGMLKYTVGETHYLYNDTSSHSLKQFILDYPNDVFNQNPVSPELDSLVTFELLEETENVNGIECQVVLVNMSLQTDKYWFNTEYFPINTNHLQKYNQTSLGHYFSFAHNIPLKFDIANGFLSGQLISVIKDSVPKDEFNMDLLFANHELKKQKILDILIDEAISTDRFILNASSTQEQYGVNISLDSLPKKLTDVRNLKSLVLSGVDLLNLGSSVANLVNLEDLSLGNYQSAYAFGIPDNEFENLINLKKLKHLGLSSCYNLNNSGIEKLVQLESIGLAFLRNFPEILYKIDTNLNVYITQMDYEFFEKEFKKLKKKKKNITIKIIE